MYVAPVTNVSELVVVKPETDILEPKLSDNVSVEPTNVAPVIDVKPVMFTEVSLLLNNLNVPTLSYVIVPPVTYVFCPPPEVKPVTVTVPPVLSFKANVPVSEVYVPPVICQSVPQKILQREFSLVAPLTPSIVSSNHALMND